MFFGTQMFTVYTVYDTLKANAQMGIDWSLPKRKRSLKPDIRLNAGM